MTDDDIRELRRVVAEQAADLSATKTLPIRFNGRLLTLADLLVIIDEAFDDRGLLA